MIRWLYELCLKNRLNKLPHNICFMLTEKDIADAPDIPFLITSWCCDLGISAVIFHISTKNPANIEQYMNNIRKIATIARLVIHVDDKEEVSGDGMQVLIAIGMSGREEITRCIREMAREGIDADMVDEHLIESYLTFQYEPDLVIKTGGDHLTDFLIWQSVYSELFFSDVNWKSFRKVDFLRALRDYQLRTRTLGK
ncbi:MAG: undecaprenyl diphosphate synthase family protein [Euryarchaeota archaeon]|nr:undecaprenyl diphosphate synthase family protein [Euryarchaeota archaeon]